MLVSRQAEINYGLPVIISEQFVFDFGQAWADLKIADLKIAFADLVILFANLIIFLGRSKVFLGRFENCRSDNCFCGSDNFLGQI